MKSFIKGVIFIILLAFIFLSVYVATKPSTYYYNCKVTISDLNKKDVVRQITQFSNWKNKSFTGVASVVVPKLGGDILSHSVQLVLNSGKNITIQNQWISDTLVVQHIYGLAGNAASVMHWGLSSNKLQLSIAEKTNTKEKLAVSMGLKDKQRFFETHCLTLLQFSNHKEISPLQELNHIKGNSISPSKSQIIRIPKQN